MFDNRKKLQPQSALSEQTRAPLPSGGLLTIIDGSLTINGDLQSAGELQVKGRINGNIHCQTIIVEEDGAVEGGILADHVLIHGRTKGFIRATHIELGPTAVVESDLYHATLIVRDGAMFEGMSETNKSQRHTEIHTEMQVDELRAVAGKMKAPPPVFPATSEAGVGGPAGSDPRQASPMSRRA